MLEPENFIPYSQIEPLLTPGMTSAEMVKVVLARCGLDFERHTLTGKALYPGEPLAEILKRGAFVEHETRPKDEQIPRDEIIY